MADGSKDEEANEHPCASNHEGLATAIVFDNIQSVECRAKVDAIENHLRHVRIVDARSFERDGAVVEEVIGTGKLLHGLYGHSQSDAVSHSRREKHVVPFREHTTFGRLCFQLGLDLSEFLINGVMVGRRTINLAHGRFGFFYASVSIVESRGFMEQ